MWPLCDCADGGLAFWKKLVAGATAGSIGAAIATPTDVLKVIVVLSLA
jgi:hypothetical protein